MAETSQAMLNQGLFEEQEMPGQMGSFSFPSNLNFPQFGNCHQSLKAAGFIVPPILAADHALHIANLTENLLPSVTQKQREDTLGGAHLLSLQRSSANLWAWGELSDCSLMSSKRSGGDQHHEHLGVSSIKMKKIKARRKMREPRFCFKTLSDLDVLEDGYKWRKYGQKVVKDTQHPSFQLQRIILINVIMIIKSCSSIPTLVVASNPVHPHKTQLQNSWTHILQPKLLMWCYTKCRSYYRCTQDNCRVKKRVERLAEDPRMVITTYEGRHAHSPSNDLEQDSQAPTQLNNFFF